MFDVVCGKAPEENEFYFTEATWMRKHGWRTPEWKLIRALEPDFHFKPEVELYNLKNDPTEYHNLALERPDMVKKLTAKMEAHIARREAKPAALPYPTLTGPGTASPSNHPTRLTTPFISDLLKKQKEFRNSPIRKRRKCPETEDPHGNSR